MFGLRCSQSRSRRGSSLGHVTCLEQRITPNNTAADQLIADINAGISTITVSGLLRFDTPYLATNNALPKIKGAVTINVQDFDLDPAVTSIFQLAGTGFRFFELDANSSLTVRGLTFNGVQNPTSASAVAKGGAIFVPATSSLTVIESTFTGNSATQDGGAIYSNGSIRILRSTFGDRPNTAGAGGAIWSNGSASLENDTFVGNIAASGGALHLTGNSLVNFCTITNNSSDGMFGGFGVNVINTVFENNGSDIQGVVNKIDYSFYNGPNSSLPTASTTGIIIGANNNNSGNVNAKLSGLSLHGGRTRNRSPLEGSPLIDVGAPGSTTPPENFDQRNFPRVVAILDSSKALPDIGSVEFQDVIDRTNPNSPWIEIVDGCDVVNPTQTLRYNVIVRNLGTTGIANARIDVSFKHLIKPNPRNSGDPNWDTTFASRPLGEVVWWSGLEDNAKGSKQGTGDIHELISLPANAVVVYHVTVNIPGDVKAFTLVGGVPTEVTWRVGAGQLDATGKLIGGTNFGEQIIADATLRPLDGNLINNKTGLYSEDINEIQNVRDNPPQQQAPGLPTQNNPIRTPILRYQDQNLAGFLVNHRVVAVGSNRGRASEVVAMDAITGDVRYRWYPFGNFAGEVHVATGDVLGHNDGNLDVIVAAGAGGGPHVKIYDGRTGFLYSEFFAYGANFTGGVYVAAGDINGDGRAEVITGAGAGGTPHVRAFSLPATGGGAPTLVRDFFAYTPYFRGGVTVASGDVNGDGIADIVTGAGPGGGPHVRAFSGWDNSLLREFFAYQAKYRGGVFVAAGNVDTSNAAAEIITSPMSQGGPHVRVFNAMAAAAVGEFFAADYNFLGGVRVGVADRNNDGILDIVTTTGAGTPSRVKAFDKNGKAITSLIAPNPVVAPLIPFTNIDSTGGFVA